MSVGKFDSFLQLLSRIVLSVQEYRDVELSRRLRGSSFEKCFSEVGLWKSPRRVRKIPTLPLTCYDSSEGAQALFFLLQADRPAPSGTGAVLETLPPIPIQEHSTKQVQYWVFCENQGVFS